jgi:hypothetical protein
MKPEFDRIAALAAETGVPLSQEQLAALREGHALIEKLRAMLHRPPALDGDLAVRFTPESAE